MEFTIAIYNVDRTLGRLVERVKIILLQIKNESPDILIIHELDRSIYDMVFREMKSRGYNRYLPDIPDASDVLFSKFDISSPEYTYFLCGQENKGYIKALVTINRDDLVIGNEIDVKKSIWIVAAQLEQKTSSFGVLKRQIDCFSRNFKEPGNLHNETVIYAGDTGIRSYNETEIHQPEEWLDAWYEMGTDDNRYTYDSTKNIICPPPFRDRTEQIWYKSSETNNIECIDYKLIGNEDDPPVSSHYGVIANFVLN